MWAARPAGSLRSESVFYHRAGCDVDGKTAARLDAGRRYRRSRATGCRSSARFAERSSASRKFAGISTRKATNCNIRHHWMRVHLIARKTITTPAGPRRTGSAGLARDRCGSPPSLNVFRPARTAAPKGEDWNYTGACLCWLTQEETFHNGAFHGCVLDASLYGKSRWRPLKTRQIYVICLACWLFIDRTLLLIAPCSLEPAEPSAHHNKAAAIDHLTGCCFRRGCLFRCVS